VPTTTTVGLLIAGCYRELAPPVTRRDTPAVSTLVGREREIAQMAALLQTDGARLVTITGPGGVGKTRLALAVADHLADDFADGVVVVSLASITDPSLALPTVARAAGAKSGTGDPLVSLERQLREADVLLVLDNLEHLVAVGPHLAKLLAACPGIRITATSRARLRLSDEHEFPLQPLDTPDCVALFLERAQAVRPDLDTSEVSLQAIEELCHGLDGLPLAIELAAARAKLLSPRAMRTRLGDRLGLLAGGDRDLPARHQALRNTLDWSYDLLTDDERLLFRRIAVFAGGFTLDAAEAVCGADLDHLSALVDNSLVRADGERFETLETVRAYTQERLAAGGEEDEVRRRHAAFYLALAEDAAPRVLFGADQAEWLDVLELEHDNLRAALDHSLASGDDESAIRLAAALWSFWLERGYVGEGRRRLRQALDADGGSDPGARARGLTGAGLLAHYDGDYANAEELCRASIAAHTATGDRGGTAAALEGLALSLRTRGDFEGSQDMFAEALEIFHDLGDEEGVARTLDRLGIVAWFDGDNKRAATLIGQSLDAFERLGNSGGVGLALTDLGLVMLGDGNGDAAQRLLEQGLSRSRELSDRRNIAKALYGLGDAAQLQGDRQTAAACYDEGLSIAVEYSFPWLAILLLERLAGLMLASPAEPEESARVYGAADELRRSIGAPMPAYFKRCYDAEMAALRGRLDPDGLARAREEGCRLGVDEAAAAARAALQPARSSATGELTAREVDVLRLVAVGLTDAEVAARLVVSVRTVHAHLRSIYRKLNVRSRSAATRFALEHGLTGNLPREPTIT
jgi:predicted ATPase/DNA-binding CsgD family transcriptional regulator